MKYIVIIISILFFPGPVVAGESIRITTGEWAPYISRHLPDYGIVPRILTVAFAEEDIDVTFGFFPWSRSMALAKTGAWDASGVWYYHPDRDRDFLHSDPIWETEEVFFHLKDRPLHWQTWSDLKGLTIGATAAYTVTRILLEQAPKHQFRVEVVPTDETNFRKLLMGYIHAFPLAKEVATDILHEKFSLEERQRIGFHPHPVNSGKMFLLFSKKIPENTKRLAAFNRGLEQMKSSGVYHRIIREWQDTRPRD